MSERETLAVEAGWRVKPLEWEGDRHEREATCSFGTYQIVGSPDCERAILVAGEWIVWRGELRESADEARQDAQADFDARIRACIEPAPEPVREAAQALLDSLAQEREWRDDPAVSPTHYGLARQQTDDDARALRAVLAQEAEHDRP